MREHLSQFRTVAAVFCAAAVVLSGCGKKGGLTDAYSFADRKANFVSSRAEEQRSSLFASDLCVVMGETNGGDESLTAEAGAVFDIGDRTVLYSKNAHEKMYPASTTKVMTALLAIEAIEEGRFSLQDPVTVTEAAVITEAGASLCGIQPGDQLSLEQLLYGLMMPSGNDAGNAIAVHMAGDLDAFVGQMNERARKLGATQTHFMNPSGLNDEEHYTTAYDLYLMFHEALKHPLFREIIGTSSYTADFVNGAGEPVQKTWTVGNWYQKGERETPQGLTVLGGKTGTTQAAGYCLIMAEADSQGKEYISVVLKADSRPALYDNMTNLITKIVN